MYQQALTLNNRHWDMKSFISQENLAFGKLYITLIKLLIIAMISLKLKKRLTQILQTGNSKLFVMILTDRETYVCEIWVLNWSWRGSYSWGNKVKEGKGQRWATSIVLNYSVNHKMNGWFSHFYLLWIPFKSKYFEPTS